MKAIATEESVSTLFCSIVKLAVEDYRYCVMRGYIKNGKIIPKAIKSNYLIGLNLRASDLPALVNFFWGGGLHTVIEIADVPIRPSRILAKLEPDNWAALLRSGCPTCDTGD